MGQSERALSALSALLLLLLCVADSGDSSTTSGGNSTHRGEADHSTPGTIVAEYGNFPPRHIVWTKLIMEKQYDRGDPPLWGQGGVTVDVMVRFLNVLNIDAALGTFETDFSLRLFWHDERLRWAPEDFGGMTQFVLSAKDELNKPLWLPEISFLNIINVQTTGLLGVLTRLLSDGSVFWGRHVNAKFVTRYEFQWFPFDYQLLRISMASVKYSDNWQHLRFKDSKDPAGRNIPPVMMRQNIDHPLFTLERVSHFASKIYYEKWKDSFTTLYTVIVAKRETTNYVTKMVLPVYLVVIASSLGYWVNPEVTAARIGLSIVCVLTQVQLAATFADILPAVAYLTWLDYFMLGAFFANIISLPLYFMVIDGNAEKEGEAGAAHPLDVKARKWIPTLFTMFTGAMLATSWLNACDGCEMGNVHQQREGYVPRQNKDF